jgi:TatA/E family protein of Tat protein translocase
MVNVPFLLFVSGAPGSLEIIVIFIVILVLFGPKRLPAIARSIGQVLNQLRSASQDFKDQVMRIEDEATLDLNLDDETGQTDPSDPSDPSDSSDPSDPTDQEAPDDLPDFLTPTETSDLPDPTDKPEAS